MKKIVTGFLLLIVVSTISCKSSFTDAKRQELLQLQKELDNKPFAFQAETALQFQTQALNNVANDLLLQSGNSTARINLRGDGYTIKIGEMLAKFSLPFYGERRLTGGYNGTNTGFDFESKMSDRNVVLEEDNGYLSYKFTTTNQTETIDVKIAIYSMKNVRVDVNSSHRTFMQYEGKLVWIVEE